MTELLALCTGLLLANPPALDAPLDAAGCVQIALARSPKLDEVAARVRRYEARLAQVQSVFYPKLSALGWVAPMFTVRGTAQTSDVDRDYSPSAWGPYAHFQAVMAWPLYTFGRAEAGIEAAEARAKVEVARLREARNVLALEVRRLYYLALYARSMLPSLDMGIALLTEAEVQARALYDRATGEVTQVDLAKLRFGIAELTRLRRIASDGAALALAALKHTMGLPDDAVLTLAESRLPKLRSIKPAPPLVELMKVARESRPEWEQLAEARIATRALETAERRADAPALFLGGELQASWAPTRQDSANPYHYDPYNDLSGGAAVGLKWDFDPALSTARVAEARARKQEVEALGRFAETGIALQVREAHQALTRHADLVAVSRRGERAGRKWMTFAAAAYKAGTGPARDLLEGLVTFLQARRTHYGHVRDYLFARAALNFAVGRAE